MSADPCDRALSQWCERWFPEQEAALAPLPVAVAFSGGADSTAVLMAAFRRWPGRLLALHVHHGLQAAADGFEAHVRAVCEALAVPLKVAHVNAAHAPGESPEDAARQTRYAALAEMAQASGVTMVLLGQHADDQVETLFMALGRGAGLPGLAAMAPRFTRHTVAFGRPLLNLSSQAIRESLALAHQGFVEDPTNTDQRFTRNRVRAQLMPAWETTFPGFRETVTRSARHAARAQSLLEALAAIDLHSVGSPPRLKGLQALGRERQVNALRFWLKQDHGVAPSEAQMGELVRQIDACRTRGHRIELKVANGQVRRVGECLGFTPQI